MALDDREVRRVLADGAVLRDGEFDDRRETRFWVVGKRDDAADVARATDPRS